MAFTRTQAAASGRRQPTWQVVEAIAADAVDAGRPIRSLDTLEATADALADAGMARTTAVVGRLMEVAAFTAGATPEQRDVFRRYTPAAVHRFHAEGWTAADTARYLGAEHRSADEMRAELESRRAAEDINDAGHRLLNGIGNWLIDAARFAKRAEAEGGLDAYSASALEVYRMFNRRREDAVDTELRLLVDNWQAREAEDDPAAPPSEAQWSALLAAAELELDPEND